MWEYLTNRVYGNNPQTIPNLKAAITAAIRAIPREECGRVIEHFARQILKYAPWAVIANFAT